MFGSSTAPGAWRKPWKSADILLTFSQWLKVSPTYPTATHRQLLVSHLTHDTYYWHWVKRPGPTAGSGWVASRVSCAPNNTICTELACYRVIINAVLPRTAGFSCQDTEIFLHNMTVYNDKVRAACDNHLKLIFNKQQGFMYSNANGNIPHRRPVSDWSTNVRHSLFQTINVKIQELVTRGCFGCSEVARSWSPVTYFQELKPGYQGFHPRV